MSLHDDLVAGMPLASQFVHQAILKILVAAQVQPTAMILGVLDGTLLALEKTQGERLVQGNSALLSAHIAEPDFILNP